MKIAVGGRVGSAFLAAVVALAAVFTFGWGAATHVLPSRNGLTAADPPPNALLAEAPDQIALTFAVPIDPQSASVVLLGAGDLERPLDLVVVDPADPSRILASPSGPLGGGDYFVIWSARAASNGEHFAGAYPFRAGIVENPGAARLDDAWPEPWATILRWLVFLGTALAAGGFGWSRLMAMGHGARRSESLWRRSAMVCAAFVALLGAALPPLVPRVLDPAGGQAATVTASLRAMPLGWWIQLGALLVLAFLCLVALANRRMAPGAHAARDWVGLSAGLVALVGLSLTSHAASPWDGPALALEIAHQWSTALWASGLLYLAAGWRGLGTDVARFRRVRWIGGVLVAISVLTGAAAAWRLFPSASEVFTTRYGQVLAVKSVLILVVLALGALAMIVARRSHAIRASESLGVQSAFAVAAALLATAMALMAAPGTIVPATLAGVDLVDVAPLDAEAFGASSGMVHLLTQPDRVGLQTLVVLLTDERGSPLAPERTPVVHVDWTPLADAENSGTTAILHIQADPSGAVFSGAATLPLSGWWRGDVVITPPDGIASRAQFWLVLPDPNVSGQGPDPETDPDARALFDRGLESLTSVRSIRVSQRLNDGGGSLYRSQSAVSADEAGEPTAFSESVLDAAGSVLSQQVIVGDQRWTQVQEGGWQAAEIIPLLGPGDWGEAYVDATGFQLGPREEVDSELCQVITFWQPPRQNPARAPAWFAWWVGLASGEVRRETMVATRQYSVNGYSDFDAPLGIVPPIITVPATPRATPAQREATPVATPGAIEPSP